MSSKKQTSSLNKYLLGSDLNDIEAKLQLSKSKTFFYTRELGKILSWDSEDSFKEFERYCETARTLIGGFVSLVPKKSKYLFSIVFYEGKYFVYFEQIDSIARLRSGGNSFSKYEDVLQYLNDKVLEQEK